MSSDIIFGKESIVSALNKAVNDVNNLVKAMNKDAFEFAPQGKWNAGQQLDHLIRSMKPLNLAYALPAFILKWRFGKANRPSKTYTGLVEKYESKLIGGARATGQFIPKAIAYPEKDKLIAIYENEKQRLVKKVSKYNEANLDKYILPHPLLGKLTLREMLYFTIYHNIHHQNLIIKYARADFT
jgi:tRNA G37 N-methylase Trm5